MLPSLIYAEAVSDTPLQPDTANGPLIYRPPNGIITREEMEFGPNETGRRKSSKTMGRVLKRVYIPNYWRLFSVPLGNRIQGEFAWILRFHTTNPGNKCVELKGVMFATDGEQFCIPTFSSQPVHFPRYLSSQTLMHHSYISANCYLIIYDSRIDAF